MSIPAAWIERACDVPIERVIDEPGHRAARDTFHKNMPTTLPGNEAARESPQLHPRKRDFTMTAKPKLEIANISDPEDQTDKIAGAAPDPFNVEALKLDQNFEEATGFRNMVTTVPVRKPHSQDCVRVHPGEDYRGIFGVISLKEESGEFYLLTPAMARDCL